MNKKRDPVTVRSTRLFQSFLTKTGPMLLRSSSTNLSQDALIDSFLALFDECSKESLKKDVSVKFFVNKFNNLVTELRALRVNLNDFNLKSVIGKGHFGDVRVVKEKSTGDVYALKIINKTKTLKNASSALFEEERDILSTTTSKWLTSLQYAFQDEVNLYLVMDYMPGGDLSSLLDREGGRLTVDQARFYLAETLLAIHDLHRMGYVHRDIKPDNVLLDRLGHVKLGDFGSAARLFNGRVVTAMPAGTPDYIAPEVLQVLEVAKPSYGIECDFWSLGVLAYALVVGTSPFSGPRTSITFSKIINHEKGVTYPTTASVTDSLKDLINGLLQSCDKRLDYCGIRKHAFFLETDFSTLRQTMPPIVPVVNSPDDVSNFIQHEKKSPEAVRSKESGREFSGKQLPFIGYTYSGPIGEVTKSAKENDDGKTQQKSLEILRKENQELLSKLLIAQKSTKANDGSIELLQRERANLQRDLTREKQIATDLRKCIQDEREDRRKTEEKALVMVRQGKQNQEKELKSLIAESQTRIDELNDRLTKAHTVNNELTSRCDRAEGEVLALRAQVAKYQDNEKSYNDNINKAREFKRRSVTDFESRLDRIQSQEDKWQKKVNAEVSAKQSVVIELQQLQMKFNEAENNWTHERKQLDEKLQQLHSKLVKSEMELSMATRKLEDTSKLDAAHKKLAQMEDESMKLRGKINSLETELSNANCSFLELETKGQQEQLTELENELRAVTAERDELQNKILIAQQEQNEVKNKLGEIEKISELLVHEVSKLEEENLQLKKGAVSHETPAKLCDETEIQYQQRIIVLEQQIARLESQLERLRESAVLEKKELRTTHTQLYKTERELSNAKIDVRIAQREAKTLEEQVNKLTEEVKSAREKVKKSQEEKQTELREADKKIAELTGHLKKMEQEVEELKKYRTQVNCLSDSQKQLEREYNGLREQLLVSEKQLTAAKAQVDALQLSIQALTNEKTKLTSSVDELRTKIGNLELNNTVLRETSKMQDEQLEDYEKFVGEQTVQVQSLMQENTDLKQMVNRLEADINSLRLALNEEKNSRNEFENVAAELRAELMAKTEVVDELRLQLEYANSSGDSLSARLHLKDKVIRDLETESSIRENEIAELHNEMLWLKEEMSAKLSDIYLLKEDNSRLNMELEEANRFSDVLHERIQELEHVITELETYHRQREMKDEATKQQQNKLISFLQTKIQEDKKKRNFADKLFGARRRDPPSPQTPLHTSPRPAQPKSTSAALQKKIESKPINSPRTEQAMKQLVASPTSQHPALTRMHHKIPHRFKIQTTMTAGKCVACHSIVSRGSKASTCIHCPSMAHPNCASTAPKTCGLPTAYAEHFVRAQNQKLEASNSSTTEPHGWIDIMMPGETSWKRRYVKVDENSLLVYETEPKRSDGAVCKWDLLTKDGTTLVSDEVTTNDLPNVARNDLPFVIKVVQIPGTTCWPGKTIFLLIRNPADKIKWITALQGCVSASDTTKDASTEVEVSKKLKLLFSDDSEMNVNCVQDIADNVILFGTDVGLFSLHNSSPVQIFGVTHVHNLLLAPQINLAILIVGEGRRLVVTDYRLMVSNANAAKCTNPGIVTDVVELSDEEPVVDVAIANKTDNHLAAATTKNLHILRWCELSSRFKPLRSIALSQPVTCITFHQTLIIMGCRTFQSVSLHDFSVKELMGRTNVSQSLLRLGSSPMRAMQIGPSEILLCFRELGLFVNDGGLKTRPDLKWAHVPMDFAFCAPFLYVFGQASIEIVHLALVPDGCDASDDALSIATTATISDSECVSVPSPAFLGVSNCGGVFVKSCGQIYLLPQRNNSGGSNLQRVVSDGQFSFTSSLMSSLEGDDSENEKSPHSPVQHTEL